MESLDMPVGQIEGSLPPCLRIAGFEGRRAWWHDTRDCTHSPKGGFYINVHAIHRWKSIGEDEPLLPIGGIEPAAFYANTDDPEEAERLWLKAQRVLLGEAE